MDFSSMIEKIMPYVQVGDNAEPFIISRQNGKWVLTHTPSSEIADDILASVKEKDPIAIKLLGGDFSRGSFPFVSDKVLIYRLYEEEKALLEQHKENNFATLDNNKLGVFVDFLEDCMPEFSQNAVDLIASLDKPLELLYNKVFKDREISYSNDLDSDGIINENIGNKIADEIENYANTAINLMNEKAKNTKPKECAAMIDKAINEVRTDGKMSGTAYYNLETALDKLNDNFGSECIAEVLAAIIVRSDYDGRYSRENKAWAKSFDTAIIEETIHSMRYVTINTHPCVLNGLADDVRKQKASLLDKLDINKKKVAAQPPELKDNPIKKQNEPEVT